jgi:hypothetical protein
MSGEPISMVCQCSTFDNSAYLPAISGMTKTGKGNEYWANIMRLYAQGKYHFGTGKKPGSKRWKDTLKHIDQCPRQKKQARDLLGNKICCKCGYHEVCHNKIHLLYFTLWIKAFLMACSPPLMNTK